MAFVGLLGEVANAIGAFGAARLDGVDEDHHVADQVGEGRQYVLYDMLAGLDGLVHPFGGNT